MMSKNLYMHLIDGRPAMYEPRGQIVFVNNYNHLTAQKMFVDSLETIRRQQAASIEYRTKNKLGGNLPDRYGYLRMAK
jgi:hypothetical protein